MIYSQFWLGISMSILEKIQDTYQMNHRFFLQTPLPPAVKLPAVLVVLLAVSFVHICALILLLLLITRKQKHSGRILIVITNMTIMSNDQSLA